MTMFLATAAACCLATATGLALDSQRLHTKLVDIDQPGEARSCENATAKSEVRAAMCLAGNARTFGEADVVASLRSVLQKLKADSHPCTKQRMDLFAYVTLTGDLRKDNGEPQLNATKEAVEEALQELNATAFQVVETSGDITKKNYKEYVVGRECFQAGYWRKTARFVRSLNQLRHIQLCLQQVVQQEAKQGHAYDAVIVSRPDMIYRRAEDWGSLVLNTAVQGLIHFEQDWFLAMPRAVVNAFFDPDRSMPLTCHPGEFCCGRVARSEDMFEYIMGAHLMGDPCPCDACYCSKNFTATRRGVFVKAGGIARGDRLAPRQPKPLRRRYGQNDTVQNVTNQSVMELDEAELDDDKQDEVPRRPKPLRRRDGQKDTVQNGTNQSVIELDEAELDDDKQDEDPDEEPDEESGF